VCTSPCSDRQNRVNASGWPCPTCSAIPSLCLGYHSAFSRLPQLLSEVSSLPYCISDEDELHSILHPIYFHWVNPMPDPNQFLPHPTTANDVCIFKFTVVVGVFFMSVPWGTYYFPPRAPRLRPSLFPATICCSYQVYKGQGAAARTKTKPWAFLSPFSCSRPPQLPFNRDSAV